MDRLRNLTVARKMALAFGGVLVLMLFVGLTGFLGTRSIARTVELESSKYGQLVLWATDIRGDTRNLRRFEKDYELNLGRPAKMKEYDDKWHQAHERVVDRLGKVELVVTQDAHKRLVSQMQTDLRTYDKGWQDVKDLVEQGKITTGSAANDHLADPKMGYKEAIHRLDDTANKLAEGMDAARDEAEKNIIDGAATIRNLVLFLLIAAFGAGAAVAVTLARAITTPLAAAVKEAEGISQGRFAITAQEELGQIGHSRSRGRAGRAR